MPNSCCSHVKIAMQVKFYSYMDCWMYIEPCRIEIGGFGVKTQIFASQTRRTSLIAKLPRTQLTISLPGGPWCNLRAFLAMFINRKTPKHHLTNTIYIERFLIMKIMANLNIRNKNGL